MFIIEEDEEKREQQKERALKLARFYHEDGLYKDAVRSYELYIFLNGKDNTSYEIYKDLGICYSLYGENTKAISKLEKAYELNKSDSGIIYLLSQMHEQNCNYKEAEEYYIKLITMDGTEKFAVFYSLGDIALRAGNVEKAIEYFKKVVEIQPTNSHAYFILGEILYQYKKNLNDAEIYFRNAHENGLKRVAIYEYLGHIYLKQGIIENAKVNFLIAAGKEEWAGSHYKNYLKCLNEIEIEKELKVMEELQDYDVNFFRVGLIELHRGNIEKAEKIFMELDRKELTMNLKKSVRDELNGIQKNSKK